jgi:hypothetical protein
MCSSPLCQEIHGWVHANPIIVGLALLFAVATIYRLGVRGRWITIVIMVIGWVALAAFVMH